jgi:hypothetical protein
MDHETDDERTAKRTSRMDNGGRSIVCGPAGTAHYHNGISRCTDGGQTNESLAPCRADRSGDRGSAVPAPHPPAQRTWVAQGFTWLEDIVYLGLGLLLGGSALVLLVTSGISFGQSVLNGTLGDNIITLLDQILLILLIVELLYTVQVSFREHVLVPEPFLIIVLIATTRRVLVLTAEFPKLLGQGMR